MSRPTPFTGAIRQIRHSRTLFIMHNLFLYCYYYILYINIIMLEEMNKLSFILLFPCALFILLFVILSVTYHLHS